MYFLELADEHIRDFKSGWGAIGDSIVVVGGDGLWNCHVHTNDIGAAIEVALDLGGRPKAIRVSDLFEEVDEEHAKREAELAATAHDAPVADALPEVTTAVVAVCSGDGLVELFAQLGVQGVVTGGQTMNPSTAELLESVQRVNADQVVILPNNKNIIPVAEQVGALTEKTVVVVPTRSMPEALAALVVYDPEADARRHGGRDDRRGRVGRHRRGHPGRARQQEPGRTGRPRATGSGWCAATASQSVAATVDAASMALLDRIVGDDAELVTSSPASMRRTSTTEAIRAWLGDHRGDVAVEVHRGGQPLYPYLFGVE